jgi:Brp/Blh family beta-carotene 15,15'-monooxygenase
VAWHFFPTFSLLVFILFSAFHFGEAELKENNKKQNHSVLPISSFLLGLCILLSIIFSHYRASAQIISYISPGLNNYLFPVYGNWYAALIVLISCLYIIMSMYYKEGKLPTSLMLILFLGMLLPLELAFGFYFIFQHSYNAWQHLQIGLALPAKTLYKQAMPYTIGAILIGVMFYFFNEYYSGGGLGDKGVRYKKEFFENLPLPSPSSKEVEEIISGLLQTDMKKRWKV